MKTHQPITMIALSCLLMLTLACENKAVRSVSGIEDLSSGDGPHEVADEKASFGDPVVQFEEESLGGDGWAVAALPRDDFSANQEGADLVGEADRTGSESSSGFSALMSRGAREPSSRSSGMPNSKGASQAKQYGLTIAGVEGSGMSNAKSTSQAPARDLLAASGPSPGTSSAHDDGQRRDTPVLQDLRDIFFAYDSWQLSRQSHQILESNAKWLKAHPHARITIEGHCDQRGTQAYNYILGQRRAETTQWYLSQLGVPSRQMAVVSFGKDQPLCYVFSAACFQSNRRAHFSTEVKTVSLN